MWSPMRCKDLTQFSTSTIYAGLGRQWDAMWPRNTSPGFWGGPVILPFPIELADAGSAPAVHITDANELPAALDVLGLHPPRPTVVVVGGAAGLEEARIDCLRSVFATGIAPVDWSN
jgi:hypothetical protein